MTAAEATTFTIGWLYPDLMNIYGDRGNIVTLFQRARWRGLDARVLELGKGPAAGIESVDVFFFGGGQDREQALVYDDLLETKAVQLAAAVDRGAAVLAVCGGYQLLGHYYETATGEHLPGIGLIDVWTRAGDRRCIGDVVVEVDESLGLQPSTLVGFENHSGRTFLGDGVRPLGRVLRGSGNNGADGTEGAAAGNLFGTYLHGSLLPKNPHLADLVVERALRRRLEPLDDSLELAAHRRIVEREVARRA
ncbi:MAG TPA: glutamine amidotransferase [Candidatus Eisenbacteria bacterium]|nr:glutamine amidotransferase [Candidatus Eisenbacteria bacterium]